MSVVDCGLLSLISGRLVVADPFMTLTRHNFYYAIWRFFILDAQTTPLEGYFNPLDTGFLERTSNPQKWTLLHQFIMDFIVAGNEEFEHHRNDMLALIISEYETVLDITGIKYKKMQTCPDEIIMHKRIDYLRGLLPLQTIVQTTFQVLFGDRNFLFHFTMTIGMLKQENNPQICAIDGVLKRCYVPDWVKKGVFFRDRGKCALCTRDLTGTIATSDTTHYDHIFPLAAGGSNDPTNFQLLCQDCNLKKGMHITLPSEIPNTIPSFV
jgi:hypothetical protein